MGGWKHGRWTLSESQGFVVPWHGYLLAGSVGLAKDFELRLIMACSTNVSWWVVDGLLNFQLDAKTAHEALLEILAHIWNFRFT